MAERDSPSYGHRRNASFTHSTPVNNFFTSVLTNSNLLTIPGRQPRLLPKITSHRIQRQATRGPEPQTQRAEPDKDADSNAVPERDPASEASKRWCSSERRPRTRLYSTTSARVYFISLALTYHRSSPYCPSPSYSSFTSTFLVDKSTHHFSSHIISIHLNPPPYHQLSPSPLPHQKRAT